MFTNLTNIAISSASTDLAATLDVSHAKVLGIEVKNTGAGALDVFEVWGRFSPDGNLIKFASIATDFSTPVYPVTKAGGTPVTLAAGATAWMFVDVTGLAEVQLKASGAAATTLEIHAARKEALI